MVAVAFMIRDDNRRSNGSRINRIIGPRRCCSDLSSRRRGSNKSVAIIMMSII